MHNKSKYKQEGGGSHHHQPGFGHISSYTSLQTQRNTLATQQHCSHLSESRDCSINSCFSCEVEKKEECFLPSKEQKCGKGTRKLLYTCVDHNGVSFTLYLYHKLNYLKNKKNGAPFWFNGYARVRCTSWPQKREKNLLCSFFIRNHWIKGSCLGFELTNLWL